MPLPDGQKCDDISIRLDTLDRRSSADADKPARRV